MTTKPLLAVLLASALVASAQLPQPKLHTVFPPGAKTGSTVDVAATGAEMDEAQLRFNHPGITAKALAAANQFTITVASDVPPGTYAARLRVPDGKNIRDSWWMTAPPASGRITISRQGATRWG